MRLIKYLLLVIMGLAMHGSASDEGKQMAANSNAATLHAYAEHVYEYVALTPQVVSGSMKWWLDETLALTDKQEAILELGSAFGRDAAYMQSRGYVVRCTDAVPQFVTLLKERGFDAHLCNALTDELGHGYGLVFANAVLLHFTGEEVGLVLRKIEAGLQEGGLLAFSVKRGDGEAWSDEKLGAPRYFRYWQADALQELLESVGFRTIFLQQDASWILVIARKV
jgi:predicted TPR repeat methyltransferase